VIKNSVYRFYFARCMNIFNSLLAQLVKYDVHTTRKIKIDTRYFSSHIIIYLHTPCSSANGMNHTCLCLSSRNWYSFTDPGGTEG